MIAVRIFVRKLLAFYSGVELSRQTNTQTNAQMKFAFIYGQQMMKIRTQCVWCTHFAHSSHLSIPILFAFVFKTHRTIRPIPNPKNHLKFWNLCVQKPRFIAFQKRNPLKHFISNELFYKDLIDFGILGMTAGIQLKFTTYLSCQWNPIEAFANRFSFILRTIRTMLKKAKERKKTSSKKWKPK